MQAPAGQRITGERVPDEALLPAARIERTAGRAGDAVLRDPAVGGKEV